MPDRLIDNQTLRVTDAIKTIVPHASRGRFAVGYFFVSGFDAVADSLTQLQEVKLLIGSVTNRQTIEDLALGYRRQELIQEKLREQRYQAVDHAINATAEDIRRHVSELQPGEREERTISKLAELIASGKLDVRIYTRGVLHAKAYIFDYRNPQPNSKGIGIVGSSNLTEAGLTSNTELNVQVDDDADIFTGEGLHRDLGEWFDKLWAEAKPFSEHLLKELRESWALSLARPYDVYLKMLFELVRSRLEDDASKLILPEDIPLAAYQKVAVQQAIGIVKDYRGAFVADVVGVGKSFIGAAVARHFYESERRRPLILCPNALEDMWKRYNRKWHLNAEIVPFGMLRERPTPEGNGASSVLGDDRCQDTGFVLIDESHNFRHPESQRYALLTDFLMDGADRKVLLLTATPYNKSCWDVYYQAKLFHTEENTRIPIEPRNIREYFKRVQAGNRKLQDLLVHLLVRRTRWQLLRWYGYDEETDKPLDPFHFEPYLNGDRRAYLRFPLLSGDYEKKFFPTRELRTIEYCVDDVYGLQYGKSLYEEIVRLLWKRKGSGGPDDPDEDAAEHVEDADPLALTYGRYGLWHYVLLERQRDARYQRLVRAGKNLRGLIRTSLFKRLESSVAAFRESVERQVTVHKNFLKALDSGKIAAGERAASILEGEYEETDEALAGFIEALGESEEERGFGYDIADFRVKALRDDVKHDLESFEHIAGLVTRERIPPDKDAKLQTFLQELPALLKRKKLLVFSQYEDTAKYVFDNLPERVKDRAALVTGDTDNVSSVVKRFAPEANMDGEPSGRPIDILIATDVLAEGLNLQDCNQVLNYDLHWNPVRLIQRFGRVDRIGSKHDQVFAINFLPEKAAEAQLGLKWKLQQRIKEFNEILGMDSQVLDESERVNPEAVYAIYEQRAGKHLGRFEADEGLIGATLAEAEEFFRELRERDPAEYARIRSLRDGIRTARATGGRKVLVLGRAGDFLRMYVYGLDERAVDIDTMDAMQLAKCGPEEEPVPLPLNLNSILTTVKLRLVNDVDELWKQQKTKSALTAGQRYVIDELEKLRRNRPILDADGGLGRLIEAASGTRQKRFQRPCERLRRSKVTGDMLLRSVRQLYYDCALHMEHATAEKEEIELRIPRIVAVMVV